MKRNHCRVPGYSDLADVLLADLRIYRAGAGGAPLTSGFPSIPLEVVSQGTRCTVRLTGPVDTQIGQQYIREITTTGDSAVISFHAVMKNVSGYPQNWSEQSVSQYNATAPGDATQFNPDFWGMTAANPSSTYLNGYHVRTGTSNNPGYSVRDGIFRLHWNGMGGEVWIDSPGGWAAVVDDPPGTPWSSASAMIRPQTIPTKRRSCSSLRPDNVTGFDSPRAGRPADPLHGNRREQSCRGAYRGESYAMDTQWCPTRMGSEIQDAKRTAE